MTNQPPIKTVVAGSITNGPRIEITQQGQSVSFALTQDYHVLGRDPNRIPRPPQGLVIPANWVVASGLQATLRKVGKDYFIYDGDGVNPSSNRLFINGTVITPTEGYKLKDGDEIRISQNPTNWITITYSDRDNTHTEAAPKQKSIYLKDKNSVVLGRNPDVDLELNEPTISRQHAVIQQTNKEGTYQILDKSSNGVFVNRQKISGSATITTGDIIQIGPYTFVLQQDELVLFDRGNNIRLDAKDLVKVVKNKDKNIVLLNHITLVIEPGQFVALVGGSGAGKSTLMKALLGIESIKEGQVYLNGDDLNKNFNIYRNIIGYVPQNDIVHTNLKVKEVLYYAAKLRLPSDIKVEEIVEKTLQQIELTQRQDTLVKSLSGGQLKRVSIGVELLANPKLFFLDEPTSGLDPGLDKKMMELLRKLANEGRTIILVTHATSNIKLCDRLVFLGYGGNLCYFGPPEEAIKFFQISSGDFADIYIKLENKDNVANETARYHESQYQKQYIDSRLIPQTTQEKQPSAAGKVKSSFFRQLSILTRRYIKLIQRDPVYLVLSLLTAPIGIALIRLAIQGIKNTSCGSSVVELPLDPLVGSPCANRAGLALRVLFVFTCAAIWTGFSSSLQEIVKESAIYLRERLVNLGLFAYIGSKILTLGGLAVLQSILISIVILIGFKSPEFDPTYNIIPWFLGAPITTFLTIMASISLGLMISASVKNSSQANSALPLLLLPQIIFAGVLFKMENSIITKIISWLTIGRWSVGAYGTLIDWNLLVPPKDNEAGVDLTSIISDSRIYDHIWSNLGINWGMLLLHTVVYLTITFWLQKRKDIIN